jgi:hypothetical protein
MRTKLKLQLDQLTVDSFDTSAVRQEKGTVFGEQCTCYTQCTCPGCPSCYESCNGSCNNTCNASCYGTCYEATCNGCTNDTCNGYCTAYDVTCRGIGTCGIYPCADIP